MTVAVRSGGASMDGYNCDRDFLSIKENENMSPDVVDYMSPTRRDIVAGPFVLRQFCIFILNRHGCGTEGCV